MLVTVMILFYLVVLVMIGPVVAVVMGRGHGHNCGRIGGRNGGARIGGLQVGLFAFIEDLLAQLFQIIKRFWIINTVD